MSQRRNTFLWVLAALALAGVIATFSILTVVATNYQHIGRLMKVTSLIKRDYLQQTRTVELIDGAMRGMVASLKDPYSAYMDPKEYEQLSVHLTGTFGGVGIYVDMKDGHKLTVVAPIKRTPAERAGIKSGDIIIKINNKDAAALNMDAAVAMMKGKPGTAVTLTVWRESDKKQHTFRIVREVINIPSAEGEILKDNPEIAHIRLLMFSANTGEELSKVINELKPKKFKAVIFDLRDNPGGELNAAVNVASYFIPQGPVVHIVGKSDGGTLETKSDIKPLGVPLVVLVNGNSASASEIVSGAIKDTGSGTLVGTKTFGKGLVQTIFNLDGGAAVKLTTAKYLTPKKHDIHKKGIIPDVVVQQPPGAKKDLQLAKAVEILEQKIK